MKPKNTICLWFNKDAHEAARFYAATFPDSKVTAVHKAPGDYPGGKAGERRRRFYRLTPTGQRVLLRQRQTWDEFVEAVRLVTGGEHA